MKLMLGDCLETMKTLPDNSVDAVVTDPPYGLSFMNKHWDVSVPSVEIWREVFRVLKPGGHLLSFGGTRTYHHMAMNIELAGFEIRDQVMWIYGQGFPKSLDISKAIDKQFGAEREVVGMSSTGATLIKGSKDTFNSSRGPRESGTKEFEITAPSTPKAKQYSGWGTALKPANEPICLARKPLEGTVAKNVLKWGVGGLNIDESRIEARSEKDLKEIRSERKTTSKGFQSFTEGAHDSLDRSDRSYVTGRFPSNVILDEVAAEMLDEQTGILKSGDLKKDQYKDGKKNQIYGQYGGFEMPERKGDSGGASRFFYVAKTSKRERNAGLEDLAPKESGIKNTSGRGFSESDPMKPVMNQNHHPTVKPIKLMTYLIKLITPPGGVVLDPFMGSGSTGVAAIKNGFEFIGCEMNQEYFDIAERRIQFEDVWPSSSDDEPGEIQLEFNETVAQAKV